VPTVPAPTLTLRPFAPEDLPVLQPIRQAAFAPIFRSLVATVGAGIGAIAFARADEEQARLLESLCAAGTSTEMLVAMVDGRIVGFVSFSADAETWVGEIGLNAVHPDHAGKGLGTVIYRDVLKRMKGRGMTAACVSTGGDPGHAPAHRAYEKAGFGHPLPSVTLYRRL
jgi:GNAT superfamily N-acetyltransferase